MVLAVLQPKQPATLPFEFIAAVKNTTPLVGCAEPGVISDVLGPVRALYSSAFCASAALGKTIPRPRRATLADMAKTCFIICLLVFEEAANPPSSLPALVVCEGELGVNFQEVVHSIRTGNADVAKPQ
jgi:hypothetical protein